MLVRNTGAEPDVFDIVVQGEAAPWVSVDPAVVELAPDQEAPVWLRFHPPRSATTAPGPAAFDVAVVSRHDPTFVALESGTVDVAAYTDLSVAAAADPTVERRTVVVPVTLINAGNAAAPVTVCVRGDRHDPVTLDVPAGDRVTVDVPAALARRREGDRVVVDVLPDGLSLEVRMPQTPSTLRRDLTRSAVVLGVVIAIALVVAVTSLRGEEGSPDTTASDVTLSPSDSAVVPGDGDAVAPDAGGPPDATAASTTAAPVSGAAAAGPPADLPQLVLVRVYGPDDRDLVVRAAGAATQETRLRSPGSNESQPVLSPDRARVAYVRERGGVWNACVIAAVGGDASCGPSVDSASSVGWRADGRSIVVSNGGRLRDVEYDPDTSTLGAETDLGVDVPSGRFSLSPDGERVAFSDGRRIVVRPLAGGEGLSLRVPGSPQSPRWSQDGARIVYVSEYQVYSAPVGDGPVRRLTAPGTVNGDAASAGAWVVFRSNRSGGGDLYAVRADAKDGNEAGIARITSAPERDVEPSA